MLGALQRCSQGSGGSAGQRRRSGGVVSHNSVAGPLGLKGGHWLGWGPMHHWTHDKIRVHAFTCMLGVSLLQHVRQGADVVWPSLSMEELKQQLSGIQQIELLYPRQGQKGPPRVVSIATKQTLAQQALLQALDLEELIGSLSKPRGYT